jgi:hypothetical protein
VSEGVLWRRRLGAELRRAAPRRRVAVLRGRASARAADSPLGESLHLVVVERDRLEARLAEVVRDGVAVGVGPWLPAGDDDWPGERDRLVDALREALA